MKIMYSLNLSFAFFLHKSVVA